MLPPAETARAALRIDGLLIPESEGRAVAPRCAPLPLPRRDVPQVALDDIGFRFIKDVSEPAPTDVYELRGASDLLELVGDVNVATEIADVRLIGGSSQSRV